MAGDTWTETDTVRARQFWEAYQRQHDVTERIGQTAGIDAINGEVWFGASAKEIVAQLEAEGVTRPLYFVRVGADYYFRKGRRQ